MVGYKFCQKMADLKATEMYDIVVFGEENRPAYDRVHLSSYLEHFDASKLEMTHSSWYQENGIELIIGDAIIDIHTENKTVLSHNGIKKEYDTLVLATGSKAFVPDIDGIQKEGVFVYRTIEDMDKIVAYAKNIKNATVLGGGLLGLEAAKAVLDLNLKTHVVEFAPRLMPRQLDELGSNVLKDKLLKIGIKELLLNKSTKLLYGKDKLEKLIFSDDTELETEMLVISAGIVANDYLAKIAELKLGVRGGVVVNEYLQSSNPNIYAIGEVACFENMIYGLVAPGYDMATALANNLVNEEKKTFASVDMSTKLKLIGIDVASFGDAFTVNEDIVPIIYEDQFKGIYKRINVGKTDRLLKGGILVGDADDYGILLQMTLNKMKLPEDPISLIVKPKGEAVSIGAADLPDSALICSCESINKGQICKSVKDGIDTIDGLKKATKAGTGCGGCVPLIKDLIKITKTEMGIEVRDVICEHFNYSRQELYHLAKVKGIKTYNNLLDEYGDGDGCEICKPLVASILASLWNDLILANGHDTIQDTNDRFLANIQRGGTYSVVPRIPGGEISAEKLLVIGTVAKKYDLYTKITGGQRIDLFGARIDQLPDIWKELIDAGFESGQAYGKSLRTVKSCVGTSWCRYGVQDSVGFAIEIENRYKGLRSPHKLKSAVSGCIRECAEAQSKDFGVIATDKGWNIYVCGNGGSKPQHALLLAQDVEKEWVIKYLDRFLMFYIKTADPLQRTAPWLNKLEGGLDYLKAVVLDDSLGIAEELEAHMEAQVNTYLCEWKDVVEDPEKQKKFKHFANADAVDSTIEFVPMRDQKMPKPW